jgi:hypothetical protein
MYQANYIVSYPQNKIAGMKTNDTTLQDMTPHSSTEIKTSAVQENAMGRTTTHDQANWYQYMALPYLHHCGFITFEGNEPGKLTVSVAYLPTDMDKLPLLH